MPADAYQYQAQKLNEIKKTLQGVLDGFQKQPEKIAELLSFKSQFYNYSMNNVVLIHSQNPNTTFVASYQDWKKKEYHVLKGQHGLKVLFPIRTALIEVGEQGGKKQYRRVANATSEEKRKIECGELKPVCFTRFGVGTVFDISQTDCPPEKYPSLFHMGYSSGQHAALYRAVKEYAEKKGFPVHETDLQSISLRGDFTPATGKIRISDKLNDTEKLSTLTHELGHALMHGDEKALQLPEAVRELEADCISIMLQNYVGLDLTDLRKRHFVQNYDACKNDKDFRIEDILKDVNMAYYNLHKELEPIFDRLVPEKAQEKKPEISKGPESTEEKIQDTSQTPLESVSFYDQEENPKVVSANIDSTEAIKPNTQKYQQTPYDYKEQDAAVLEKIKYGVSILTLATDMGFTPKLIGGYYTLKEHDSVRIYLDTNSFNQFSSGVGGSTIDFAMHFGGYNKKEAIQYLKERYAGNTIEHPLTQPVKKIEKAPAKTEFKLPEKVNGKFSHVFAYLTKIRCLDTEVVKQCFRDKLIYEDIKHNAVFIGKDASGKPAYATRRSTLTQSHFKCDVAGGRQDLGFYVNNRAEKLYVCEAPIDALSIMSLMKEQGKPLNHANYLATCGTGKDAALYTRLRENPEIREVVLANDHDTAGWKANKKELEKLSKDFPQIKVSRLTPKQGKDINEFLCNRIASPKTKTRGKEVER